MRMRMMMVVVVAAMANAGAESGVYVTAVHAATVATGKEVGTWAVSETGHTEEAKAKAKATRKGGERQPTTAVVISTKSMIAMMLVLLHLPKWLGRKRPRILSGLEAMQVLLLSIKSLL